MPIVMSPAELARITRWTDANREEPEVAQRRELIRYLDETSKQMTKSWPNSLENVNKRNEELRQARIQASEQANATFYKRYVKKKKEEQARLMHSARDTVFKNKDAPKLLLSAVIETCVQKERIEQLKFQAERKRMAAEQKRKEDEEIIRKAKEWEQLMLHKKRLRLETDKKYQQDILDQAHEISERNRKEYEDELNMQKVDNMKANQQIEAIKEFEENFKAAEKARIFLDMEQAKREVAARQQEHVARDKMDDRLMEVLRLSRNRIHQKRLQTEEMIKAEKRKLLENISSKLQRGDEERAAKEQEILEKAHQEKEAVYQKRRQQEAAAKAASRAERRHQREQWLQGDQQRLRDLHTVQHFHCMNRFKNLELYEEFKQKQREEKARKVKEYREDMLRLWKERTDREARELWETRHFYGTVARDKLRAADGKLLQHAGLLLREARARGRPEYALRKARDRYCHMYRLYPLPDLPASLKEHFPLYSPPDGSHPDPDYRGTSAPGQGTSAPGQGSSAPGQGSSAPGQGSSAPGQGTSARGQNGAGRNGLQHPGKAITSNEMSKLVKKEEKIDYKRSSKANGLQRRNAQTELDIKVIPCQNDTCSCILKK